LLSYVVMEKQTILFLVRKNGQIKMKTIPKGNRYFQSKIKLWSELSPIHKASKIGQTIFDETGFELSQYLIKPARIEIEQAERLLIIPDGPLWYLPFAGLQISEKGEQPRYLIEEKPISTVVSASLYADLKKRPKRPISQIVAMGDAIYPGEQTSKSITTKASGTRGASTSPAPGIERIFEPRVRSLLERASIKDIGRIPQTAFEVLSIAEIFGTAVRSLLREEANEANFKNIEENVDIVHLAAHGLIDDERPLDSALLLTINNNFKEGEESGVLFAWEIFESIRLKADLVVLSACETALGNTSGGEGMIGLTRAFQFAGARSIIASYWNIDDWATAIFMEKFYRNLKDGMNKAEALRQAQIAFIRNPIKIPRTGWRKFLPAEQANFSHPYYWAAFQLIGPWD